MHKKVNQNIINMENKRLKVGKTVTAQFRAMEVGDVMEINFKEKLPHILYSLCRRLDKEEGISFSIETLSEEGVSLVKRIA